MVPSSEIEIKNKVIETNEIKEKKEDDETRWPDVAPKEVSFTEQWKRFYLQRQPYQGQDPTFPTFLEDTAEDYAKGLEQDLLEIPQAGRKLAEEQAKVLAEILKICEERIAFNEIMRSVMKNESIEQVREYLKGLGIFSIEGKRIQFVSKEEILLHFEPLIQEDINSYSDIKKFLCLNTQEPLLLDVIFDTVIAVFEKEQRNTSAQDKSNPAFEYMHVAKMKALLGPFLSKRYFALRDFQDPHLTTEPMFKGVQKYIEDELGRVQLFQEKVNANSEILKEEVGIPSYISLQAALSKMVADLDYCLNAVAEVLQMCAEERQQMKAEGKELILATPRESNYTRKLEAAKRSPLKQQVLKQQFSHTGTCEIAGVMPENPFDINPDNAAGLIYDLGLVHKGPFYCAYDINIEVKNIEAQINKILKDAETKKKEQAKIAKKAKAAKKQEDSIDKSSDDKVAVNKEKQLAHTDSQLQKQLEQERKVAEEQAKSVAAYQANKAKELKARKEEVERAREKLEIINQHRTDCLEQDLSQEILEARGVCVNDRESELQTFEVEQLNSILGQVHGLFEMVHNWFTNKEIKYSDLKTVVEHLSTHLIDPEKHQGFSLVKDGAHFTMHVPNTRKAWARSGEGFIVTPRQMTTLNGWRINREEGKKHNAVKLSPWAVERIQEGLTRAGITPNRLWKAMEAAPRRNTAARSA